MAVQPVTFSLIKSIQRRKRLWAKQTLLSETGSATKEDSQTCFNGVIFRREVVTADELEEQKGETSVLVPDKAGGTRPVQKYRIIVMRWNGKMDLMLLALESQDKIHYAMPVRICCMMD